MLLKTILIVIYFLIEFSKCQVCPEFYTEVPGGGLCIQISSGGLYTRNKAMAQCENNNAHLVMISDAFANAFIRDLAVQQRIQPWIGARCSDSTRDSCWWDDGYNTSLASGYYNFGIGSPNKNFGDCLYMSIEQDTAGQWFSDNCDMSQMSYMCAFVPYNHSDPCFGYTTFGTSCYKAFDESYAATFNDADDMCKREGGRLVSIHSVDENNLIMNTLFNNQTPSYAWIGLYASSQNNIYWKDNTNVDYTNFGLKNYNLGSCVSYSFVEDIINPGEWMSSPCEIKLPFVCKKGGMYTTASYGTVSTLSPFSCNDHPHYYNTSASFGNTYIYSPGYPESYNKPEISPHCEYIIMADTSSHTVCIRFPTFKVDSLSYMQIYNSIMDPTPAHSLTGTLDPNEWFYSSSTSMKLVFFMSGKNDEYVNYHWSVFYTSQCNTGPLKYTANNNSFVNFHRLQMK